MPFEPKFVDLVRNFTTTTGTGNIVLGTAVSGHASLASAVAVGEQFYYCVVGVDKPAQREVGRGTMTANGTVAREPIGGAPTNFTPGTKTIALVAAAEWFGTLGQMVNGGSDSLAALATTDKTSLLAAVNEVSATAAAALAGGGAGATDVLFVAAGGSAVPAIRMSLDTAGYSVAGVGRATYVYDAAVNAAFVTANPRTAFLAANGRGFKLDPAQHLTIEMFGGGTAMTAAENYAAIMAAINFKPNPLNNISPAVHFGIGKYSVSTTIDIETQCHLKGRYNGQINGSVTGGIGTTVLEWPINTKCIRVQNSNTTGDAARPVDGTKSGSGSTFEGLIIQQATMGTDLDKHGIQLRGQGQIFSCGFRNIAGNAVHIAAISGHASFLQGDANNWRMRDNFVSSCRGDGLHVSGADVNAGYNIGFHTHLGVEGCGIYDASYYGNAHMAFHITGYGNGGVFHLGNIYQLISPATDIGGATEPGTNDAVWLPIRAEAAPLGPFPQWVSLGAYRLKAPIHMTGPGTLLGGYQELSTLSSHVPQGVAFGCFMKFTNGSNALKAVSNGSPMTTPNGIGAYRGSGGVTTTPTYADEGAFSYTVIGSTDVKTNDPLKRPNILEHHTEQDGAALPMSWSWDNKNQVLRYFNRKDIWSFGGPGTARTYGRDSAQPYYFTLHDFALQDPGDSNNVRIMGLRAASPATGSHAQGEFFFNRNPTATGTLGWSCTTSGTPGTWTAISIAGFGGSYAADSTFGNLTIGLGVDGRKLRVENSTGYGLQAWMNSTTSILYLDNIKPGTGYSGMNLRASTIALWGGSATSPVQTLTIDTAGVDIVGKMAATGALTSNSPTAGVGYRAGAGGAVTQATSKTTGVTLNNACGAITLNNASLAANGVASFTLTNSAIALTDVVNVCIRSGATGGAYKVMVDAVATGSCRISIRNLTAGALAEGSVLNFAVIKAVAA